MSEQATKADAPPTVEAYVYGRLCTVDARLAVREHFSDLALANVTGMPYAEPEFAPMPGLQPLFPPSKDAA